MKNLLGLGLLLSAAVAIPLHDLHLRDDDCEVSYVTVQPDSSNDAAATGSSASSTASAASAASSGTSNAAGSGSGDSGSSSSAASSGNSSTPVGGTSDSPGVNGLTSTNTVGIPGFPLDGHHLSAPVSDAPVPADAKIYTPPSKTISGKAFTTWIGEQAASSPASKWLKITPGVYAIDCTDGLVFSFEQQITEGWTCDMRGVTFTVAGTCEPIYINQCEDFTFLGGTLWFDEGEIWTQAKITALDDIGGGYATVTAVVDAGYNLTTWRQVGPRNLATMDTSNPDHFVTPANTNYWFSSDYNFDNLDSKRTWTMKILSANVQLKVGYYLMMENGISSGNTIGSEFNSNLHVNGFTTNGDMSQIGLGSKKTATFENVWFVNPPSRPGFAPRVEGPEMTWGHIAGFDYDTPGQPDIIYKNSWWMYDGCEKDLQDAGDEAMHNGGY